jgi:hypothetical protein
VEETVVRTSKPNVVCSNHTGRADVGTQFRDQRGTRPQTGATDPVAAYRRAVAEHQRAGRARRAALIDAVLELREVRGLGVVATSRRLGLSRKYVYDVLRLVASGKTARERRRARLPEVVRPITSREQADMDRLCALTAAELDAMEAAS